MNNAHILVLGAAYGLLPAMKLFKAGHRVTMVCRRDEQQAFASNGAILAFKGVGDELGQVLTAPVQLGCGEDGHIGVAGPEMKIDSVDMVFLAMSEPYFAAPELEDLVARISAANLPVVSISNAPPPAFLKRLQLANAENLRPAYFAWETWSSLNPARVTAASPDAQAVRRDPSKPNELWVTLGSNFKIAPFEFAEDQALLERLAKDISAVRHNGLPVKVQFIPHASLFAPLAKWPMLVAGNCRCLKPDGSLHSISEAVRGDVVASEAAYEWTMDLVRDLGANDNELVPFRHYAAVAKRLSAPSSFARAVHAGAKQVERCDKIVQLVGQSLGRSLPELDAIAEQVDKALANGQKIA